MTTPTIAYGEEPESGTSYDQLLSGCPVNTGTGSILENVLWNDKYFICWSHKIFVVKVKSIL